MVPVLAKATLDHLNVLVLVARVRLRADAVDAVKVLVVLVLVVDGVLVRRQGARAPLAVRVVEKRVPAVAAKVALRVQLDEVVVAVARVRARQADPGPGAVAAGARQAGVQGLALHVALNKIRIKHTLIPNCTLNVS